MAFNVYRTNQTRISTRTTFSQGPKLAAPSFVRVIRGMGHSGMEGGFPLIGLEADADAPVDN